MDAINKDGHRASILVVDDTPANLQVLSGMLKEKGYEVRPVPSGKLALQAAVNHPPDLVLLDINMPEMDGYQVCKKFKEYPELRSVPIIFISALSEVVDKVKAFAVGGVDYVMKPFQIEEVNARVETHLQLNGLQKNLELLVGEQVREICDSHIATIAAMARLAQSRDDSTGTHLTRVKNYCSMLAKELAQKPEYKPRLSQHQIEIISQASALHDIGKVGIPDSILLKPGKLNEQEYNQMKTHTCIGSETLQEVYQHNVNNEFLTIGIEIARYHHERWDGKGYPTGLREDEIPLSAQIMAVADVYDALKSRRCYKEPYLHQECVKLIVEEKGKAFNPELIDVFEKINEEIYRVWEELVKGDGQV